MTDRESTLEAELKAARLEIKLLKEKVDVLVRKIYGTKSEKIDSHQLMLLEDTESEKEDSPIEKTQPEKQATLKRLLGPNPAELESLMTYQCMRKCSSLKK